MPAILEMLSYPFMQRAFISGALLGLMLASLGVFVTLRKMAFFGDGIAHASLAGIAIAVLAGLAPMPTALLWSVMIALMVFALERFTRLPSDTLIGIFFTASMALGVLLMSLTPGYRPELVSYLFGSILAIRDIDMALMAGVAAAMAVWLSFSFRSLVFMSLTEEVARVSGIRTGIHAALLYIALAAATVLGVKILGIILVSALIILPAATSRMLTRSFRGYLIVSVVISETAILGGLTMSYLRDLPSGATVVLVGTAMFFLALALSRIRR